MPSSTSFARSGETSIANSTAVNKNKPAAAEEDDEEAELAKLKAEMAM